MRPGSDETAGEGLDDLVRRSREVRERAYAPYSGFGVGAAVETDGGAVFTGCNVENASLGLTMCAERVAVANAVAAGHRSFRRVVISTEAGPPAPPCGACRQVLAEFSPHVEVHSTSAEASARWRLDELLPVRFRFDPLGGSVERPGPSHDRG